VNNTLRCPHCRAIEWYRDGFVLLENDDGSIFRDQVQRATGAGDPWSCMQCGHEVAPDTPLAAAIAREQQDRALTA
jgi:hypothetical protein